jgi:drug/metabolite transporter (DMT)-like permease
VGFVVAAAFVLVTGERAPGPDALAWAGVAGLAGLIGLSAFYAALASGVMSLVAPLVSVIGAGLPAAAGILGGDQLSPVQMLGIALALVSVVLVSRGDGSAGAGRLPLRLVVVAGLGFAAFFLLLDQARTVAATGAAGDADPVWWPVLAVRSVPAALVLAYALVRRQPLLPGSRAAPLLVGAGLGDLGGNAFFVLAATAGVLSVAVVVSSLYPVVTVLAASILLRERLRRDQALGIALALAAVLLIVAGGEMT